MQSLNKITHKLGSIILLKEAEFGSLAPHMTMSKTQDTPREFIPWIVYSCHLPHQASHQPFPHFTT